jgi:hypothetical protein
MGRFAPVFAIAAGPIVAVTLPRGPDRLLARPGFWVTAAAALALGINHLVRVFPKPSTPMASWVNRLGPGAAGTAVGYPSAAADFVAANVRAETGRLVSEFNWGGYLEWRLGDRFQLFLDGRTQLFTPEFWRATYLGTPREQQRFLAQVRADAAVVPVNGSVFRHSLVRLGWRPVYRDQWAEVLLPPPADETASRSARSAGWSPVNALLPPSR